MTVVNQRLSVERQVALSHIGSKCGMRVVTSMSFYEKSAKFGAAVLIPILVALNGLVAVNQWSTSEKLGAQGAKIDNLQLSIKTLDDHFNETGSRLEDRVGSTVEAVRAQLVSLEQTIESAQSDPRKILVTMNALKDSDVFYAFVKRNEIWVVPSPVLRKRLEAEGKKVELVSSDAEVYGVRMMTLQLQ